MKYRLSTVLSRHASAVLMSVFRRVLSLLCLAASVLSPLAVAAPAMPAPLPALHVLVIEGGPASPTMPLADALSSQPGRLFSTVHPSSLAGPDVTASQLSHALDRVLEATHPGDTLLLAISARHVRERASGRGFLLLYDGDPSRPAETGIELEPLLRRAAAAIAPGGKLLVLDEGRSARATSAPLELPEGWVEQEPDPAERLGLPSTSRVALATVGAPAADKGSLVSRFDALLRDRHADRDHDGILSLEELQASLAKVYAGDPTPELPAWSGGIPLATPLFWLPGKEVCNRLDDDGDGQIDPGFDGDHDGFLSQAACKNAFGTDCDDAASAVHPGLSDQANLQDDDCDGQVDEDAPDRDGNGIPDAWDSQLHTLSNRRWWTLGSGAGLLLSSALTWAFLSSANTAATADSQLDPSDVTRYVVGSYAVVGLGGAGVITLGSSGWHWAKMAQIERRLKQGSLKQGSLKQGSLK